MIEISTEILALLFVTSLSAGIVDAIAGGGGLICLPMLLSVGLPPHIALGTNKAQGSIGAFTAAYNYYKAGLLNISILYKGLLLGIIGTILGAMIAQIISNQILEKVIPFFLMGIILYLILFPQLGINDQKTSWNEKYFYALFGLSLGFYDGFLGPATGSFWIFSLTYFLGYNFQKASAYTKVFNFKSNIIAAICFGLGANINYKIAICMGLGQFLGAKIGSRLAIAQGVKIIKPVFMGVVSITIIFLLYKNYSSYCINVGEELVKHGMYTAAIVCMVLIILFSIIFYFSFMKKTKKGYQNDTL